MNFPTGQEQILERLNSIDPVEYGKNRNFLDGAVTYLSPYISRGFISLKQVREVVLQKEYKPYQIEKFLQELAWREYFQRVWQNIGDGIWKDIKQLQPDTRHHQMVKSIDDATTGIDIIDKLIQNLYSSGYMHNHVRMYTASIVCNIAKAHWLQPSKWMYYHLLDGDIASNNCSWQWVAAAFAAKKYYFNQENINKFSLSNQQHTFLDKDYADIMTMPTPEVLAFQTDLVLTAELPYFQIPSIDLNKPTLIYNSYNLDPRWRANERVNRILLLEPSHFSKFPVSKNVLKFIIALSKNISGIQLYTGEINDPCLSNTKIISKEHPAFTHYPGTKDNREWIFPQVTDYYSSFSGYWKKCKQHIL